ncbi:LamG domain-containing protein [Streptomyces thinghirensis]|nr:LamG domain-containing protein [Streptomyces thinghirensis]
MRGSHQYVDLPAGVLGDTPAITLAARVRTTHDGAWARVLDFGDDTHRYLYLAARNADGVPRFALTDSGAAGEQGLDGTAALPLDEWSHLAVTLADGTGTLYVDGTAVARNTAMTLPRRPSARSPTTGWAARTTPRTPSSRAPSTSSTSGPAP